MSKNKAEEIESIIQSLAEARKEAAVGLEEVPHRLRQGRAVSIAAAKVEAERLTQRLLDATIPGRLFGIIASGNSSSEKLIEVGSFLLDNGGVHVVADAVWRKISAAIEASYGSERAFTTTQYGIFMNSLSTIGAEYGVNLALPPYIEAVCKTPEDTRAHVRRMADMVGGDKLTKAAVQKQIADSVLVFQIADAKIPVLFQSVLDSDVAIVRSFCKKSTTFEFLDDFEVSIENISSILKTAV